jgi:hypothetical protein
VTESARRGVDLQLRMSTELGSMAALLGEFEGAGVALLGFFGVQDVDADHFLVSDAEAAVVAASRVGATEVGRRDMLVAATQGRAGVTDVLRRLAEHGVSIDMVYATFDGELVVGIEGGDLDRAIAALDGASR